MTCGRFAWRGGGTSSALMRTSARTSGPVDPGWTGIIEVLVRDLGGAVIWEPGSLVLQLQDQSYAGRVADLDALRLCLAQVGLTVVLDAGRAILADPSLLDFRRNLVRSGLMVGGARQAA